MSCQPRHQPLTSTPSRFTKSIGMRQDNKTAHTTSSDAASAGTQHAEKHKAAAEVRSKRGVAGLVVFGFILVLALVGVVVALVLNNQMTIHSFSAQPDQEEVEKDDSHPTISYPSTQIINLVNLMGQTQDQALQSIGHGADVQDQQTLSSLGFSNEVVVLLSDEQGDSLSGTPTVTLGFDGDGKVAAASYEAPTSMVGYGDVAFAPAVEQFHIVEFMLRSVGLTTVANGSVSLPDRSEYSTYESDQNTLAEEKYPFTGQATVNGQAYSWEVTLDYDYSQANKESDLAKTIKRVSVAIMKA